MENKVIIYTDGTILYQIPKFSKYLASKDGRVFSKNYGNTNKIKPLVGKTTKDGYIELLLRDDNGNRKYIRKHILIAKTFIPNPDNLPQINHIDGNKTNNNISNLEWCTQSYNIRHGINSGLYKTRPIIQYKDNVEVGRYKSCYEAERITGIKNQYIWKCLHGKLNSTNGFKWKYESEVI